MSFGIITTEDLKVAGGCGIGLLALAGSSLFGLQQCTKDQREDVKSDVSRTLETLKQDILAPIPITRTSLLFDKLQSYPDSIHCTQDITLDQESIQQTVNVFAEYENFYTIANEFIPDVRGIIHNIYALRDVDKDGIPDHFKGFKIRIDSEGTSLLIGTDTGNLANKYKKIKPSEKDYQKYLDFQEKAIESFQGYDFKTCTPEQLRYIGE